MKRGGSISPKARLELTSISIGQRGRSNTPQVAPEATTGLPSRGRRPAPSSPPPRLKLRQKFVVKLRATTGRPMIRKGPIPLTINGELKPRARPQWPRLAAPAFGPMGVQEKKPTSVIPEAGLSEPIIAVTQLSQTRPVPRRLPNRPRPPETSPARPAQALELTRNEEVTSRRPKDGQAFTRPAVLP